MLPSEDLVLLGDNLDVLPRFADGCFQLIYADPPFNTGRRQERLTLATEARTDGDRTGFGGRRYATEVLARSSFADSFEDYLGFLEPIASWASRGRCTSIFTTARRTMRRCCSTGSSDASAS